MSRTVYVSNKKNFENLIKEYRAEAYMLITLGKKFAELEKDDDFVIIEIKK